MGMTLEDAWQEEAYDRIVDEVLETHRDEIIDEFRSERMASYYHEHPDLLKMARSCLNEARGLKDTSASACLVFSQSAIEIALRDAILKPVVFGMVHEENTAALIAELVTGNQQFTKLLFSVLENYNLNLKAEWREGSSKFLWQEMSEIKKLRNQLVHRGEMVSEANAHLSLMIAEFIVEKLSPYLQQQITGE